MSMDNYEWLTTKQHALKRPDTYAGEIHVRTIEGIVFEYLDSVLVSKRTCCVTSPALFKFLDEVVTNTIDNSERDANQKNIKITITDSSFTVFNDGKTIPIELWPGTQRYKPEILFTEPMSGENFNDDEQRKGGGRNGLGAKIVFLFAKEAAIEICDVDRGLKYCQRFYDNLSDIRPPTITSLPKSVTKSSTQIYWVPDFARLQLPDRMDHDTIALLKRRAFDAAACTPKRVNVFIDDFKIPIKNIQDYSKLLGGNLIAKDTIYGNGDEIVFEVCYIDALTYPLQIGFVNGVPCSTGSHIEFVYNSLTEFLSEHVAKQLKDKKKQLKKLRVVHIKELVSVVVSLRISNPSFTSQAKEKLDTPMAKFGFEFVMSASAKKAILKNENIVSKVLSLSNEQEAKLVKNTLKTDKKSLLANAKYEPATKLRSKKTCSLFVTEGDSAKALCIAGFSVIGREYNGVFALRGKLMNIHGMTVKNALESKEILNLVQILELQIGKSYSVADVEHLPYRHLVIFTDQDDDGCHIMGLVMNVVKCLCPSLLEAAPDFIRRFVTPIVKVRVNNAMHSFFSNSEYKHFMQNTTITPHSIKYYKGLGTSTNAEAKVYFSDLEQHYKTMMYGDKCPEALDIAFNPKRADDRKVELQMFDIDDAVDWRQNNITVDDFVHKDLFRFSHADNVRSIPNAIDGFKPSQRKVLFAMLKHGRKEEIKVAQAAAFTANMTNYHHGEQALVQTIVNMAQQWVGANNVNFLEPIGQFGCIENKRTVHSAERYIFTMPTEVAYKMFRSEDNAVLQYMVEDGKCVEPKFYVPVVSSLLMNGCDGIGTGWSTSVPCCLPQDVLQATRDYIIHGVDGVHAIGPGCVNYTGTMVSCHPHTFTYIGNFKVNGDTLTIRQLPPGKWTETYKEWVYKHLFGDDKMVQTIINNSTSEQVDIIIKCKPKTLSGMSNDDIVKKFALSSNVSTTNMNLFLDGGLRRFSTLHEIVHTHASARFELYHKRISHEIESYTEKSVIADNKARFIQSVNNGQLSLKNCTRSELRDLLRSSHFFEYKNFDYLLDMGIGQQTIDAHTELLKHAQDLRNKIDQLKNTSVNDLWLKEIDELEHAIKSYVNPAHQNLIERSPKKQKRR